MVLVLNPEGQYLPASSRSRSVCVSAATKPGVATDVHARLRGCVRGRWDRGRRVDRARDRAAPLRQCGVCGVRCGPCASDRGFGLLVRGSGRRRGNACRSARAAQSSHVSSGPEVARAPGPMGLICGVGDEPALRRPTNRWESDRGHLSVDIPFGLQMPKSRFLWPAQYAQQSDLGHRPQE